MDRTIISDIHGVLADLHTPWLQLYSEESGHPLTPDIITDWDIAKFVLPEWKDKIWEIYEREYLPGLVQPIEGALEGITKLREMGWKVVFVTSPSNNENPYRWLGWLNKYGFDVPIDEFIPARNKSLIRADAIIDDCPSTIEKYPSNCSLLFEHAWNQSSSWWPRVRDWNEAIKAVRWFFPSFYGVPIRLDPTIGENEIRLERE